MSDHLVLPEVIPPFPKLDGYRGVFVGRGVFQAMLPPGVRKFADWYDQEDQRKWRVEDYVKNLLYPIGDAKAYTVIYFKERTKPNVALWRSPTSAPPRRDGTVWLRGSDGKVYVAESKGGFYFGNWPGWIKITGWRRTPPNIDNE